MIENYRVARIDTLHDIDYDEAGLEWALSELRDTDRDAKMMATPKMITATFTFDDDAERDDCLGAGKCPSDSDALGKRKNHTKR